ncbi:hypothetical protein [Streptomyces tailanensis]|uniref:hypothetical protein n=1 Tax=Streptomyces tailanensis TaxID=2569858 RepID=UPI00122E3399|nr:hypothetical protein [Streptomyces tailanensis]
MNQPPQPAPLTEEQERQLRLDRNLSTIAKILLAVFVGVAGIGTAFGISQSSLLMAISEHPIRYIVSTILGVVAIGFIISSLFAEGDEIGNRVQAGLLGGGVLLYMIALALVIGGVVETSTGSSRPNVIDVSVRPNNAVEVSFRVHADGVGKGEMIIVEVGWENQDFKNGDLLYHAVLQPNKKGDVNESVRFSFKSNGLSRLTIRARPDHVSADDLTCESDRTPKNVSCATVTLPRH